MIAETIGPAHALRESLIRAAAERLDEGSRWEDAPEFEPVGAVADVSGAETDAEDESRELEEDAVAPPSGERLAPMTGADLRELVLARHALELVVLDLDFEAVRLRDPSLPREVAALVVRVDALERQAAADWDMSDVVEEQS